MNRLCFGATVNPELWRARKAKSLTQTELAKKVDCDQSHISLIENEGWNPPDALKQRLADELEVPLETLFPAVEAQP